MALPERLKFGIFMAPFHRLNENPTLALERDLELVQWLDTLGFDEVWVGEHHSAGWETISCPEIFKLPKKLAAIASPVRQFLRAKFHTLLHRARQRKSLRVFALGQRLRHFADHVAQKAGMANGERVRRWFQDKKAGWYAVLADPQMPATSTLLDQAHNALDRKLFMMKGFHHPGGSQQAFLTGLAHLYNLIPYQRRAQHAGQCGVEVEGGRLPTADWFLNVQILTSGGFR
jgi:hypothetical protein